MAEISDMELVRDYARQGSEAAFAELVRRHVNLVYSAALRHVGIPAQAEEITQAVFIILARKAASLRPDTILDAWLYQTARYTALGFLRGERRRQTREQEVFMESTQQASDPPPAWNQLAPLLDDAIARLRKADRDAVVLRYFKGKSLHEIAAAMNTTEAAAQSRVHRALEKLRQYFLKRGVNSTTAAIAENISACSVQAAPAVLAKSVTAVALAKGATASASTLTLIKGALKIMAWTKAKTALVAGASLLAAVGTTTITVKEIAAHRDENLWRTPRFAPNVLKKVAPQVRILPTKFPNERNGQGAYPNRQLGIDWPADNIVAYAYDWPYGRILFHSGNPQAKYDFIANFPQGSPDALRHELENKLRLVGRPETQDMDVLLLKVRRPNARGLKPPSRGGGYGDPEGRFYCQNEPLSTAHPSQFCLAQELELQFRKPVIDQTALTQRFDIDIRWNEQGDKDPDHEALKQALLDQLGLELVPATMPVEMLVVDQAM